MFPKLRFSEQEIDDYYAGVTEDMARASLSASRPTFFDLLNLLSPAAASPGFRPALRAAATLARRRHYGKAVTVFAPLYVSNSCVNSCRYCDFNVRHAAPRKTLTLEEIDLEGAAVRRHGVDSLLIVAGEDPRRVTVDWLCEVGRRLREQFSCLSLEVAPQDEGAYRALFAAGFENLTCFQETYDQELYRYLHPAGPKSDYEYRLWTQLRAGRAGFRTLGVAFLLGLAPWRREAASLGAHALYLMKECWQSRVQFAFPRLTPVSGGFAPACPVDENDLEQIMLAFRVAFPECGMTVSTRESPAFRDAIVQSAANDMSAGSRVTPGGYAVAADRDVAQFTLNDAREPAAVFAAIRRNRQEVVRKNWDKRI